MSSPAGPHGKQPSQPRSDIGSPTVPPAGPRGYVPPGRGSFSGRGGWNGGGSANTVPTGPRATTTPTQGRPFNPPTGPAAGANAVATGPAASSRPTLAQGLMSSMPPIVPGGKLDSSMAPLVSGVTRDLDAHYRKLRDEEDKMREDLRAKSDRLRKSLYLWDRLGRESRAWEMRSDLSERSMKNLAGEGMGGAAF